MHECKLDRVSFDHKVSHQQRLVHHFVAERSKVTSFVLLFLSNSSVVRMRGIDMGFEYLHHFHLLVPKFTSFWVFEGWGTWVWSILCFLGVGIMIFEFLGEF